MRKVLDKYRGFEHVTVNQRLPGKSLEYGCYMSILSFICDNMCKSIL